MGGKKTSLHKKRILVTGGTGFIGGHLVEQLFAEGAEVIVPFIEIDPRSTFALHALSKIATIKRVDITDKKKIFSLINRYSIDYIVHLAAQTLVTEAYQKPVETFKTNIMGTVNLLEAARAFPFVKRVVVASSDKAYGKTTKKYTEESPLRGDHPYDVSKSSADLITQTYAKTYATPVIITRFGNVYGEGDLHMDRIIPGICEAIIKRKDLLIRSDGTFVRDYVYVKDVVNGYVFLLEKKGVIGQAYNFSSPDSFSVLELIKKVEYILECNIPYKILNTAENEIPYQHLDDKKIRKLGWRSAYSLEKTIKQIVLWYRGVL